MPTAILFDPHITSAHLDQYLVRGWRPLGQRIYSCDWLQVVQGDICSVFPTRLPLHDYRMPKRMRKLWRRNQQLFRATAGDVASNSVEKQRLNNLYGVEHPTKTVEDLSYHLRYEQQRMFDTRETRIYDGDELVAFSFFDRGVQSAYSKVGLYHPAYRSHSLGIYSMLLEIDYCQRQGLAHYYPGYISPQEPSFNYKHRLGALEYRHPGTGRWQPWAEYETAQEPLAQIGSRLEAVCALLEKRGFVPLVWRYPFYMLLLDVMPWPETDDFLDVPYLVTLPRRGGSVFYPIIYDLRSQCYQVLRCQSQRSLPTGFTEAGPGYPIMRHVLQDAECLFSSPDVTATANFWVSAVSKMLLKR